MGALGSERIAPGFHEHAIETMERVELEALQLQRLAATVDVVKERVPAFRERLANVPTPASLDGIRDIPFTKKSDLRDNYPFGLFAVPRNEVQRVHASSGTTGKPTVVGYTAEDLSMWARCVARCLRGAGIEPDGCCITPTVTGCLPAVSVCMLVQRKPEFQWFRCRAVTPSGNSCSSKISLLSRSVAPRRMR